MNKVGAAVEKIKIKDKSQRVKAKGSRKKVNGLQFIRFRGFSGESVSPVA
jgi:hypothetical protein